MRKMQYQDISTIMTGIENFNVENLHHVLTRAQVELVILSLRTPLDRLTKSVLDKSEPITEVYKTCMNTDIKSTISKPESRLDALADQTDAAVDIMYYTMNAASKCNLEMTSSLFPAINSQYNDVKEFTVGSAWKPLPEEPIEMTRESVFFLVKMIISELSELLQTVCSDMDDCRETISRLFGFEIKGFDSGYIDGTRNEIFSEWSYSVLLTNICEVLYTMYGNFGNNLLHVVFDEVHAANMRKRDSKTGKFIIRPEDGKVIKPEGWIGPDIKSAIRQNGSLITSLSSLKDTASSLVTDILISLADQIKSEQVEEEMSEAASIFLSTGNETCVTNNFEDMVVDEVD